MPPPQFAEQKVTMVDKQALVWAVDEQGQWLERPEPVTRTAVNVTLVVRRHQPPASSTRLEWSTVLAALQQLDVQIVSLTLAAPFDAAGRTAMPLSVLPDILSLEGLQELTLETIGFHTNEVPLDLSTTCLQSLTMNGLCFVPDKQLRQTSSSAEAGWLAASRLVQAVAGIDTLHALVVTAGTRLYGRPILTLGALDAILTSSVVALHLSSWVVWGAGSSAVVAEHWRSNTVMRQCRFDHCIFASTDGSLLQGLAENTTLVDLCLRGCRWPVWEAAGLADSLRTNTTLETFDLSDTGWGTHADDHHASVMDLVGALAKHPRVSTVICRGTFDYTSRVELLQELVQAWHAVLEENRVVTRLVLDGLPEGVDAHVVQPLEHAHMHVALNRSGYHQLDARTSSRTAWLAALIMAAEDPRGSALHILRQHPLMILGDDE